MLGWSGPAQRASRAATAPQPGQLCIAGHEGHLLGTVQPGARCKGRAGRIRWATPARPRLHAPSQAGRAGCCRARMAGKMTRWPKQREGFLTVPRAELSFPLWWQSQHKTVRVLGSGVCGMHVLCGKSPDTGGAATSLACGNQGDQQRVCRHCSALCRVERCSARGWAGHAEGVAFSDADRHLTAAVQARSLHTPHKHTPAPTQHPLGTQEATASGSSRKEGV